MPKIKRKNKPRKVIKRKIQNQNTFDEEQLKLIPPHLLDKIPAQMSLKPNAQSLRSMMLQRIAQPYIPMPNLTPQQQQAQNLKNDNDIKEQTINQTKQDIIVEQERKRNLQKEAAEQKHQQSRIKHDLETEKLEIKHKQDLENENNKLRLEQQKLNYDKERLDKDNELNKLKQDVERQRAIVEQAKMELMKKKNQYESDAYINEINVLKQEQADINAENEAITSALNKLSNEEQFNEIKQLREQIIIDKMRAVVLKRLGEEREQAIIERINNEFNIQPNIIDNEVSTMKSQINNATEALAKQLNYKREYERKIKKKKFYEDELDNELFKTERLSFDNETLNKELKMFDEKKENREIKRLMNENMKQGFVNEDLQKRIQLTKENIDKQNEFALSAAKKQFINSDEYKNFIEEQETIKQLTNQYSVMNDANEETVKANQKYITSAAAAMTSAFVGQNISEGNDVIDALQERLKTEQDGNQCIESKFKTAAYNKLSDIMQTIDKGEMERAEMIRYFQRLAKSPGRESEAYRAFCAEIKKEEEFIFNADYQTVLNFYNEFNNFLAKY